MNNSLINELYNDLDAKDKIINEQVLEIAKLNAEMENYKELQTNIEKAREIIESYTTLNPTRVRNQLLELLGGE